MTLRRSFHSRLLTVAVAGITMIGVAPAIAQTEIKFGHVGEPGSLYQVIGDEFARRANVLLAGKAKVVVYGSSQLGGDKEMLQKLRLGTLDLSLPSTIMSSEVDLIGMFEMPYIVKDRAHMARIEKEIFWPDIAPAVEKKGLKVLSVWENGYRHLTNNRRPITVPDDLKGIKLRVPEGKWRIKMFQNYGASPSPMKFSELFTALQTGVMDGQENPFTQIYSSKLHEIQKFLSLSGHVYSPAFLTAGLKRFSAQPEHIRTAIETAARETQAFVYEAAARAEKELLDKIRASGIQVNEVNKDAFIAASRSTYEEFGKEVAGAKALIDKAVALGRP
jgi:tripartite ATP-independent transporter DctP family solute receptor